MCWCLLALLYFEWVFVGSASKKKNELSVGNSDVVWHTMNFVHVSPRDHGMRSGHLRKIKEEGEMIGSWLWYDS